MLTSLDLLPGNARSRSASSPGLFQSGVSNGRSRSRPGKKKPIQQPGTSPRYPGSEPSKAGPRPPLSLGWSLSMTFIRCRTQSLFCAPTRKDNFHCLKENCQIQHQRHMLNIEELVLELCPAVLDARAVLIFNLRPPGDARSYRVTLREEWDLLLKHRTEDGPFRTRAD